MAFGRVPQPSPQRMVPVPGHPIVVGVVPGQPELVALTAAAWSDALGGVPLYFGYSDPSRIVDSEDADGTVRHSAISPDQADDSWQEREALIRGFLATVLADHTGPWEFRYLAGRADRALTHLARAVDASAIVVGAKHPSSTERLREFIAGSVAVRLARHQHRPVVIVPLAVVDWKAPAAW
ncbi:MAG: universal stress protein [Propionicimonas sp.]|uniref:universal stress protein n=1 Tax=Propionicimonas sp. TaxID=1955623 RepID=UPI003D0B6A5B